MLHERLKLLRQLSGVSQKELAEKINKSTSAYNRLELGKIKLLAEELPLLAQALNCSIADFFKETTTVVAPATQPSEPTHDIPVNTLTEHFESITGQILDFQEKSEQRMRSFMKELLIQSNS